MTLLRFDFKVLPTFLNSRHVINIFTGSQRPNLLWRQLEAKDTNLSANIIISANSWTFSLIKEVNAYIFFKYLLFDRVEVCLFDVLHLLF